MTVNWEMTIAVVGMILTGLGTLAGFLALKRHRRRLSAKDAAKRAYKDLKEVTKEKPQLDDPLDNNAKGNQWTELQQGDGACVFQSDGYYVETLDTDYRFYFGCCNGFTNSNFVFQVKMAIINGKEGGLIFRWRKAPQADEFCYFYITTDGFYGVEQGMDTKMQDKHRTILSGKSGTDQIKKGLYETNVIAVMVFEDRADLFVNGQHLQSLSSISPDAGKFGVASGPQSKVAFSSAKMWEI